MINATVSQDLSRFVSIAACGSRTLDVANHGSVFETFWIAALRAMATVTLVVSILQTYPMVSIMLFAHRCVSNPLCKGPQHLASVCFCSLL